MLMFQPIQPIFDNNHKLLHIINTSFQPAFQQFPCPIFPCTLRAINHKFDNFKQELIGRLIDTEKMLVV